MSRVYARSNTKEFCLQPYDNRAKARTFDTTIEKQKEEVSCRICLQSCPYVEICDCRGTSMAHISCIKEYISKGSKNIKQRLKCQICGYNYGLVIHKKCQFSCRNGINHLKQQLLPSILFFAFCVITIIYIGYCCYMNNAGKLSENMQLILLIVGVCMVFVVLIISLRWIYMHLFINLSILTDIQPIRNRKQSISTHENLNYSTQHIM